MAVTFVDLHTEEGVKSVEEHLAGKTYISGYNFVTFPILLYDRLTLDCFYSRFEFLIEFDSAEINCLWMMLRFTLPFQWNPAMPSPMLASGTSA